ncbi:MAG TPA: hypothetical protein DCM38_04290 [Gammaproteobacteria bacterium]|nr:hypothetical protein [Gammaproteobacteria bacterium]
MSAIGGGIAFLSTIIGLFVFITGKSDLPSLLSSANIVMQEWNQDEASKIVLSILPKEFPRSSDSNVSELNHFILNSYYLKYDKNDERFIMAAYSKPPDFECHVCAPTFSFIEFKKLDEEGWILGRKHLGILTTGAWGEPPESIKVHILGNETWGVFIEGSYTQMGQFTSMTSIYVDLAGAYHEVFSEVTYEDNSASGIEEGEPDYSSLKSDISIRPVPGAPFFDLVVTTNGIQGTQQISEEKIFKFDGQRYSSSDIN